MKNLNDEYLKSFLLPEMRGLEVSAGRKRLWGVLLDLLLEFDRVCKVHDIKYVLDSGTLLGAVRHHGMIPWDDDIDVVMFRSEYEKLCSIAEKEFSHPYFFQTNQTDPGSARGHAQLRNSSTTGILKFEMKDGTPLFDFNQGLFIDIFPMDDVPDSADELRRFRGEIQTLRDKIYAVNSASAISRRLSWFTLSPFQFYCKLKGSWCRLLQKFGIDVVGRLCRRLDQVVQRYNGRGMKRCGNVALNPLRPDRQLFPREVIANTAEYEFEGFRFPGPADYETVLRGHYGNWHEHVIGAAAHGGMLVDVDHPYTDYVK